MPRGDMRNIPVDSPNSTTWKARAEEVLAMFEAAKERIDELETAEAERDELGSRLEEIASIAAPDLVAREERIDQALQELRQQVETIQTMLLRRFAEPE